MFIFVCRQFCKMFGACQKAVKHTCQRRGGYDLAGMTNILVVRMRLGHERTVDLYVR